MVDTDQQSRSERIKWLLGRYPDITPEEVRSIIAKAPGVRLVDDQERNYFPMPVDASGKDEILVGRIRRDLSDSTGRSISICASGRTIASSSAAWASNPNGGRTSP